MRRLVLLSILICLLSIHSMNAHAQHFILSYDGRTHAYEEDIYKINKVKQSALSRSSSHLSVPKNCEFCLRKEIRTQVNLHKCGLFGNEDNFEFKCEKINNHCKFSKNEIMRIFDAEFTNLHHAYLNASLAIKVCINCGRRLDSTHAISPYICEPCRINSIKHP